MSEPQEIVGRYLVDARAGSREALGQVLELCRGYLLRIAGQEIDPKLLAKGGPSDLVQETFMEAQRDFARFHGTHEEELLAWLRQLLLHNVANFTRRYRGTQKREVDREVELRLADSSADRFGAPAADTPSPSAEALANEQAQLVQRAMDRLPEEYRRAIILRNQDRRSFAEIGQTLRCSPDSARRLWSRAIEALQQQLEGHP